MSSSDFCSGDQSSSVESVVEDDGGLFAEESFFGPKPWKDAPLTHARLARVVSQWVCEDWQLRPGQFEVVKALRPSGRVFCGFPTAAGKTLIACANALLDYTCGVAGVYDICQPLQALVGQTALKLTSSYFARTRIEVVVWDDRERDVVVDIDFANKVVVILSSPEELDHVFLLCERNRARIRGLMVDEAHLRAEWPFRNYLASDRFTSVYPIDTRQMPAAPDLGRLEQQRAPVTRKVARAQRLAQLPVIQKSSTLLLHLLHSLPHLTQPQLRHGLPPCALVTADRQTFTLPANLDTAHKLL